MVSIFQAKHGTLAYIATAVTWDATTKASGETFTANVNEVKDLTVTLPEQEVETINLLGNTQQTIGINTITAGGTTGATPAYFQNTMLDIKSSTNWKFEGTVVFTGDEEFFHILGLGTSQAITGGNTRYAVGSLTSGTTWTKSLVGCLRIFLNNGSEEATVILTNTAVTKIGALKPIGADGHWECEFSAECLPKDGAIEFKD